MINNFMAMYTVASTVFSLLALTFERYAPTRCLCGFSYDGFLYCWFWTYMPSGWSISDRYMVEIEREGEASGVT